MTEPIASQKSTGGLLVDRQSHKGGVDEYLHFDENEQKFTVEKVEDVEPILKDAKARHNDGFHKNKAGDWYHAGRFPAVLVEAWLTARNLTIKEFKGDVVKDFLNDSNHSAFRIWPGQV